MSLLIVGARRPWMRRALLSGTAALVLTTASFAAPPVPAAASLPYTLASSVPGTAPARVQNACAGTADRSRPRCLAIVRTDVPPRRGLQRLTPGGLSPADLQRAYGLPSSTAGRGQTIAIVDAFDNPHAEADLAVYRRQYGLPPCTTANRCFRKVDETGGTRLPRPDVGWGEEEALDLDVASAICPNCRLLLVEASRPEMDDLGAAINTAVRLGARFVSASWGGDEDFSAPESDTKYFDHPGVAITAASGDSGYGTLYPATSRFVTAVGGTALVRAAGARGWRETAWSGGGSGCSGVVAKPSWQKDAGCAKRTVADVSAVADPATGVAVYDTFGPGGWLIVGGTSAAAPLVAGAYALAGTPPSGARPGSFPYAQARGLYDVTSGRNGSCRPAYLCTAGPGYDGPTGLGSPHGVAAFTAPRSTAAVAVPIRQPLPAATARPAVPPGQAQAVPPARPQAPVNSARPR